MPHTQPSSPAEELQSPSERLCHHALTRSVRSYATTTGPLSEVTLTITESPWKELPTLWNIVKGLCTLKAETVREVYHEVKQGASDGSTLKRIEK